MVGVLKVDNIPYKAKFNDLRRLFNEHGLRPENIHFLTDKSGRYVGSAFVVFMELDTAKQALIVDGVSFMGRNISVQASNPRAFDAYFPGKPLLTSTERRPRLNSQNKNFENNDRIAVNRSGPSESRSRTFEPTRNDYDREPVRNNRRDFFTREESFRPDDHKHKRSRSPFRGHEELSRSSYSDSYGKFREEPGRNTFNDFQAKDLNQNHHKKSSDIDYKRCVKVNNMPSDVSDVEIQRFFEPILTREVFYLRHESGRLAGTLNGTIIVEFYSESDAHQATKLDRKRFGGHSVYVGKALKDEVYQTLRGRDESSRPNILNNIPDVAAVASNPQVQHLINLLSATVTNLTGGVQNMGMPQQFNDNGRRDRNRREVNDPVVSRVANSANINVGDISMGKVIGIRNLPYSVTPGEILQFFKGYHAIADSVRIHYLEDGRCSGDAIISFHNHRDAKDAVSALNKRSIARRKVELFFL